ncbi:MAG: hypothetical protein ACK44E_04025 [Anaerolineales bacterium]
MTTFFYRHLPHFHLPHATYFVTFRLAGSLPVEVVQRLQEEHEGELRRLRQNLTGAALHQACYEEQKRHFAVPPTYDWARHLITAKQSLAV